MFFLYCVIICLPYCFQLSVAVLIDGLQAPNISGKDDLRHQICHQSYESKKEFGILIPDWTTVFLISLLSSNWRLWQVSLASPQLYKHVVQIVEKFIKKVRQIHQSSVIAQFLPPQSWINSNLIYFLLKFFLQCKPEYKVAGLYVVDSIVRQSRHQFGADKDVFGPRFTKNITGTFENLCLCPVEDRVRTTIAENSMWWILAEILLIVVKNGIKLRLRLLLFHLLHSLFSCLHTQSKIVRVLNLWQKNGVFKIEVIQPLLDMAAGTSSAAVPYTGTDEPGNLCECMLYLLF